MPRPHGAKGASCTFGGAVTEPTFSRLCRRVPGAGCRFAGHRPEVAMSTQENTLELTFIGTATVLLRHAGFTILTDPNFLHAGDHAYLGLGLRSRRLTNPALEIDDLPPIDFVLLSHHHGDHFDDVAAERLDKDLTIITEPGSARKLRQQGF